MRSPVFVPHSHRSDHIAFRKDKRPGCTCKMKHMEHQSVSALSQAPCCLIKSMHAPDSQSQQRRAQPSEPDLRKRQEICHRFRPSFQIKENRRFLRQGIEKVNSCRNGSKYGHPAVHDPVISKKAPKQRQQDQSDGQRIKEHEHRQGPGNDRIQAQVRHEE